jgi:anaerobic magnesium-protoporphyrin IX monomethyl ester cyclase
MSVECVFTKYTGPVRCFDQFVPDLALAYLSSALKREGYTCELIDLDLPGNSAKGLLDYLGKHKPDILAIKLLQLGVPSLIEIAEEAKKISPTTLVIGGGPHARLCKETIFEITDAFDALLIGESDRAIVQMVEVAHGERYLGDVENVVFRDGNGRLVKKPTSVIHNLDELPLPDWGLYDLERYLPIFLISASKGCPFACAFCNYNYILGRETIKTQFADNGSVHVIRSEPNRKRTLPSLQQEIRHCIEQYGVRLFALADALPDVQLTGDLCDWLIDSKITTRWNSYGRVKIFDGLFAKMARAGWVSLWFGIESGSEKILKRMNKLYTPEDIRHTISAAKKAGVKCTTGFVVGFPGEDESTLAETLGLIQELSLDSVVFSPFTLAPGSLVAETPEAYGVKPHEDWIKKYAYIPNGHGHHDIPYFDVEGEDNVSRTKRFNPLVYDAYKKFQHRQLLVGEVGDYAELADDYADLLASMVEGMSTEDILRESNALLKAEDVGRWHAFLSRMWRATGNIG